MRNVTRALVVVAIVTSAAVAQETPPSRVYGGSRTSEAWIDTPKGRVAVDQGVAWQGVKVWLSLTWDLVATDEATGKTLWCQPVGAFWNAIGFKEVETAPGTKTWAVELRPAANARRGADLRQYHELRTGKRVGVADPEPDGTKLALAGAAHGRWCALTSPLRALVGSEAEWKATVLDRMFPGGKDAPNLAPIDFSKHMVLVIASGETWNCNGIEAVAWEDDRRILVRLRELTFQSEGGGHRVRPWGVFVLPRRDPFKTVVVQENQQGLIGGPPIWEELVRFDGFGEKPAPQKAGRAPR